MATVIRILRGSSSGMAADLLFLQIWSNDRKGGHVSDSKYDGFLPTGENFGRMKTDLTEQTVIRIAHFIEFRNLNSSSSPGSSSTESP